MHKIKNKLALLEKKQEGNHGEQIRRTSYTKTKQKPKQTKQQGKEAVPTQLMSLRLRFIG